MRLFATAAVLLALATGCASRAAAPSSALAVDTSDPSFTPREDGFVMVESAREDGVKTSTPPPQELPTPNHESRRGSIHAALR